MLKFYFGSNLKKKKVPNHSPEQYPPKEKMLRIVISTFFSGELRQSEKLSEIKPSLAKKKLYNFVYIMLAA